MAQLQEDKARYETYRNRAEELRAVAESMKNSETREIVLDIAAEYDKMADRLQSQIH